MKNNIFALRAKAAVLGTALGLGAGAANADQLTVYSGRGESFVAPIIAQFQRQTGITVNVRYGDTAALAVLLQEEGARSPADIFWAQDAGALGATAEAGMFVELPADVFEGLPEIFRSSTNEWVATSGRSRVIAYSLERASEDELPESILDLTDERYAGRVAWAPTNGGFQAHVTAMRVVLGEDATRDWLEGMRDNDTQVYRNNTTQVQAIGDGEVDFALVNNYYLARFTARDADYPVAQTTFAPGDIGNLVNIAGVGVLASSENQDAALRFVRFLLSPAMQQYVTSQLSEYPVIADVIADPSLPPFDAMLEASPDIDLDALKDLDGTLNLLREVGLL